MGVWNLTTSCVCKSIYLAPFKVKSLSRCFTFLSFTVENPPKTHSVGLTELSPEIQLLLTECVTTVSFKAAERI